MDAAKRHGVARLVPTCPDSTLDGDWGFLPHSDDNGGNNYGGHVDRQGDISWTLDCWRDRDIVADGDTMRNWGLCAESDEAPSG